LSDGKKDFVKATKHKDFEAKRMSRKEILNAKEKLVHALSWKARQLYKSAMSQLTYAKSVDNLVMMKEGEESLKDANKNLQESQVSRADLLFDIADDRLFYAKKEKNQGKIAAAKANYRKFRDIKAMAVIIESRMQLQAAKQGLMNVKDAEDPMDIKEARGEFREAKANLERTKLARVFTHLKDTKADFKDMIKMVSIKVKKVEAKKAAEKAKR